MFLIITSIRISSQPILVEATSSDGNSECRSCAIFSTELASFVVSPIKSDAMTRLLYFATCVFCSIPISRARFYVLGAVTAFLRVSFFCHFSVCSLKIPDFFHVSLISRRQIISTTENPRKRSSQYVSRKYYGHSTVSPVFTTSVGALNLIFF